jgi:hypothetical protein
VGLCEPPNFAALFIFIFLSSFQNGIQDFNKNLIDKNRLA